MRKIVFVLLFTIVVESVSVYAETWAQFIQRAHTMTENFYNGINRGHWSAWGDDKWGALMATTYWLEDALEDIFLNAPHLSQSERNIYRGMWQRRRTQSDNMSRLIDLAGFSNSRRRNIVSRWEHWERHLNNGGTIMIN